jgi:hypothetical protein
MEWGKENRAGRACCIDNGLNWSVSADIHCQTHQHNVAEASALSNKQLAGPSTLACPLKSFHEIGRHFTHGRSIHNRSIADPKTCKLPQSPLAASGNLNPS